MRAYQRTKGLKPIALHREVSDMLLNDVPHRYL